MSGYGNDGLAALLVGAAPLILAFLIILAILWFLLPFAVFGIKGKLDRIIELQEEAARRDRGDDRPPPPTIL